MATSDDEYLAPVINLFGDRSGPTSSETAEATTSSEESATSKSSDDLADSHATYSHGADVRDADMRDADIDHADIDDVDSRDTEQIAPLRALPTMADFTSRRSDVPHQDVPHQDVPHQDVQSPALDSSTANSPTANSKAERRQARDGFSEISRVSMRALARRGMSSHEMTQFLGTREFESDEIEAEVERLESSGLLDDAALAETLARTLRDRKGLGASAISAELRRRKIDQEHISAVLDVERDDEQERATEIALKRAPQLRSLDSVTAKRRLTGFLMRRGYSGSIVSAAVAVALAPGAGKSSGGPFFR